MPDINNISRVLTSLYPDALCSLEYGGDPWRLLVAARLSAQCTDERVNIVCLTLFERYPTVFDMASAELSEVEQLVRPCGLFHVKAQNIIDFSRLIIEKFGGDVPDNIDDLLSLPGIGRKIANLLLGDVFGQPAIVADTHCIRINGRFGFYPESLKDPAKVEKILDGIVPKEEQADYCHRMVLFGREYCTAKSPSCAVCPLSDECDHFAGIQIQRLK